jgi:hypothetical protein
MSQEEYPPDQRLTDRRDLLSFEEILSVVSRRQSVGFSTASSKPSPSD